MQFPAIRTEVAPGMSDRTSPDDPDRGRESRLDPQSGLQDLRARLDELQHSVESLGASAGWEAEPPTGAGWEAEPPPAAGFYDPPGPAGYYDPPSPPYSPPPPQAPLVDPYQPAPPAATNGHGEPEVETSEVSARWATVAIVEAGPFADLIELRHFEDDLSALAAVSDVRVRRFGHGRAMIEVGMTGPYPLSRELFQLNRPMELSNGPEGEVVIELAPLVTDIDTDDEADVESSQEASTQPRDEAG